MIGQGLLVVAWCLFARPVGAGEAPCPAAAPIAAYAHNDYENKNPLFDALRLGYRGVEADVFLVDGELRVAHDRKNTRPGRTLQSLYLEPLRTLVAQCGRVSAAPGPFLLNVEIKEQSRVTYDSLCAVLDEYVGFLTTVDHGVEHRGAVEVILVGWHPPLAELERESLRLVHAQQQVLSRSTAPEPSPVVRLVSLNYGKTVRWSGHAPMPASVREWLDTLQRAKGGVPGRIVRVFNIPPRAAIYRVLLESGVDLVGTEDLEATDRALRSSSPGASPRAP